MRILHGNKLLKVEDSIVRDQIGTYPAVLVDIGTGSGRFVYDTALKHPDCLVIGMDPCPENMADYAAKAARPLRKGGTPNTLWAVSRIEELPAVLEGIADRVTIHLPWGGLRDGIVLGEQAVLRGITALGKPGAALFMLLAYCEEYERGEMFRRSLPSLDEKYLEERLSPAFSSYGIRVGRVEPWSNDRLKSLESDWAKKLAYGKSRTFYALEGRMRDAAVPKVSELLYHMNA